MAQTETVSETKWKGNKSAGETKHKKETKYKTEKSKVDIQSWLINQQERSIKHDHNHKHNLLVSNIAAADASRYQWDAGGV